MVELLVFLIAIFLIATPIIALILLVRYSKVRSELSRLGEENARQHASFQRELADLKRQLSVAVDPAAPAAEKTIGTPARRSVTSRDNHTRNPCTFSTG